MKKSLCFDDVLLEPQISNIQSRRDIDISSKLGESEPYCFKLPIISSPMDTITGPEMAAAMFNAGGLGLLHRYNTISEQISLVEQIRLMVDDYPDPEPRFGAAIGITDSYLDRATELYDAGVRIFCVDVAHGHHTLMEKALKSLRELFEDSVHLMAGNVATLLAFNDLSDWGADSIRVGVGGGSICSTRVQTGHGIPTLESIFRCASSDRDAVLIADGGIKNSGDMVKAYAAGADFVMCGSLLAGTDETPGPLIRLGDGTPPKKVYRGMASREAQTSWRGKTGSIEGVSTTVSWRGPVADILHDLEWGIRSGLSYSGARNMWELHSKAIFIEQSNASQKESSPHALNG
jgi:IMP dehydrogenase